MVTRPQLEPKALTQTKKITGSPFDPLVKALFPKLAARVPQFITPNMVTISGMAATTLVGLALALSRFAPWLLFPAAALMFYNWITDTLDGELARARGQCSKLGDFLDHVFDAMTVTVVILGTAFSGLGHSEPVLVLGMLFLLAFAITYKGEQATGVYELLTLGPTEVRFALAGIYITSYFVRGPILPVLGVELTFMDLAATGSCLWAFLYDVILFRRYSRLVVGA